ncbi:MAG: hypothetical protein RIQ53_4164 [Pseudomonadota bacterium]|jgi:HK97 family phage major capsid protein
MPQSIQALRERKADLSRQANALLADKGAQAWTKDDQAKFDNLMDESDRLGEQIKAHQRMIDAAAEDDFADILQQGGKPPKAGRGGAGDLSAREAVALFLRLGNSASPEQVQQIRAAMSTTTGTEGGYTVPTTIARELIEALKDFGGMRDVADVVTMASGEAISYPTTDGTAEEGEIVGENAAASSGDITFGTAPWAVYKFSSKKIAIPWELIGDSSIDVVALVLRRIAQRIGRIQNRMHTTGTGTGQPWGIVPRSALGKAGTTGQATSVIYDDLVDLQHSVNNAYRRGARFMMADSTVKVIRKIKDAEGRPIFVPGYDQSNPGGAPDRILNTPITVNDDMPAMSASAKSIVYGDLKLYKIRDVNGMDIRRFDDSAFALNGQVGFCGWHRSGGNLMDTAAVKHYQNSAS